MPSNYKCNIPKSYLKKNSRNYKNKGYPYWQKRTTKFTNNQNSLSSLLKTQNKRKPTIENLCIKWKLPETKLWNWTLGWLTMIRKSSHLTSSTSKSLRKWKRKKSDTKIIEKKLSINSGILKGRYARRCKSLPKVSLFLMMKTEKKVN